MLCIDKLHLVTWQPQLSQTALVVSRSFILSKQVIHVLCRYPFRLMPT